MATHMAQLILRFVQDDGGATAIEYGLIAAGISVAIIAVVQGLGPKLQSTFTSVQNALNYPHSSCPDPNPGAMPGFVVWGNQEAGPLKIGIEWRMLAGFDVGQRDESIPGDRSMCLPAESLSS